MKKTFPLLCVLLLSGALLGPIARAADYSPAAHSILPQRAYGLLAHMSGGDFIPVSYLYDKNNPEQKAAVRKAFTGANGRLYNRITREEAYLFVRQQFDLRAIKELGGKEPVDDQDIDEFIRNNHDTLRKVTRALYEGRLSVYAKVGDGDAYPRDFEIIFKSFGRPNLTDPLVASTISHLQRVLKKFPTAKYTLDSLTDNELIALTGRADFNELSWAQRRDILTPILQRGPEAFAEGTAQFKEAYNRAVINFYEDSFGLANFAYYRNGLFNDYYGPPTDDMRLHMYMIYNKHSLRKIFGEEQAKMFFDQDGRKLNYDLTYEAAMAGLSSDNQKKLQDSMDSLVRPSLYIYSILRSDFLYWQGAKYLKRVSANKSAF